MLRRPDGLGARLVGRADAHELPVRLLRANDSLRGTDTLMTYDEAGNVLTRQTDGNLSGSTYSGGKVTTFSYDSLDRETVMAANPSDGPNRTTSTAYWPSGDVRERIDPNMVAHDDYYDQAGHIVRRQRVKGSTVDDQPYTYDVDENRTTDEKGTEAYNSRDQLVSWHRATGQPHPGTTVTYGLNGAGAVTRVTDAAGPDTVNHLDGDRLTSATSTLGGQAVTSDYGYDGFGNLLSIHQQGTPSAMDITYVFDSFERLVASNDPTQSKTALYTYDGLDRRDTQTADGSTTTYGYIASTGDLSQEAVAGGARKSYDYDTGGNRQGQQVLTGSTSTYRTYVTDAQGTVQGFEDPTGAIQPGTGYHYDPYGTPQDTTGALNTTAQQNPFRFQGFYYDPSAGGYNAQAREYRPDIQRFLTQDRYEAAGSDLSLATNPLTGDRYAYVAGNPTNRIDNDGHCYGIFRIIRALKLGGALCGVADKIIGKPAVRQADRALGPGLGNTAGQTVAAVEGALVNAAVHQLRLAFQDGPNPAVEFIKGVPQGFANGVSTAVNFGGEFIDDPIGTTGRIGDALLHPERTFNTFVNGVADCFNNPNQAGKCAGGAILGGALAKVLHTLRAGSGAGEGDALRGPAARGCEANSFTADTPVTMADGTKKPIRDIKVGDRVLATDPHTGKTVARPVTQVIVHGGKHTLVDIRLEDGTTLTATAKHPVWDETTHRFTYAIALHAGDQLREPNGTYLRIAGLATYTTDVTAYNLTISSIHTYYAGTTPILVHNSCGGGGGGILGADGTRVVSKTLLATEHFHIDVENPAPGVRAGQLHLQDYGPNGGTKYYYDFAIGEFGGLPRSLARRVANNPRVARAVAQAGRVLGVPSG